MHLRRLRLKARGRLLVAQREGRILVHQQVRVGSHPRRPAGDADAEVIHSSRIAPGKEDRKPGEEDETIEDRRHAYVTQILKQRAQAAVLVEKRVEDHKGKAEEHDVLGNYEEEAE